MKFFCIHCGQKLRMQTMHAGDHVRCPSCGKDQKTPEKSPTMPPAPDPQQVAAIPTPGRHPDGELRSIPSEPQSPAAASGPASRVLTSDQGRKYQLGGVVAKGGMGTILDATDANIRRNVAMKVMLDPKDVDEGTVLRFIQEAQVTGQLEHPNIVPVHELGLDASGNVFYTMKFVRGVTLDDVLKRIRAGDTETVQNYPLARLLNIFQKVCDAIAFAHSRHVIHRDLKPENIMIGDYGEVLVMDWGLAKVVEKTEHKHKRHIVIRNTAPTPRPLVASPAASPAVNSLRGDAELGEVLKTMSGSIMGTPGFMAPEQATGNLDQMDERTDIYALGAILYNILTLQHAIEGGDLNEILRKIATGDIVPPTAHCSKAAPQRKVEGRDVKHEEENRPEAAFSGSRSRISAFPHLPGNVVPDSLSAVTMKALALEPADRYPTVQALQKEIEAYQGGFATSAEHAGPWRHVQLFFHRHRTVAILSSLATIAVIGGAIISTAQWIKAAGKEKEAREALAALSGTAPALVAQARTYIERGDLTNAVKQATYAADLMPNAPEYQAFKGDMLECALEIKEAAEAYEKAVKADESYEEAMNSLRKDGADTNANSNVTQRRAKENLALCRKILAETRGDKLSVAAIVELHVAMRDQERFAESLLVLQFLGKDIKTLESMYRAMLGKRGIKYKRVTVNSKGRCILDLDSTDTSDLRLLQGMPVTSLNLTGCPVTDITPLQGMPLTSLNLASCPVTDLTPLKGMPLTTLNLTGCPVTDLAPLQGMPLATLNLADCPVTDLTPLLGMKTLMTIGIDPWPIAGRTLMQFVAANNAQKADTEAERLIKVWGDVPAMSKVVQKARTHLDMAIPF